MLLNDLKRLLAPQPILRVGTVTAHNADGTSTIQLLDGSVIRARGTSVTVNHNAFVRAGLIEGEAPDLPVGYIEV